MLTCIRILLVLLFYIVRAFKMIFSYKTDNRYIKTMCRCIYFFFLDNHKTHTKIIIVINAIYILPFMYVSIMYVYIYAICACMLCVLVHVYQYCITTAMQQALVPRDTVFYSIWYLYCQVDIFAGILFYYQVHHITLGTNIIVHNEKWCSFWRLREYWIPFHFEKHRYYSS